MTARTVNVKASRARTQRGVAMVEAAVVLPIFALLLFGVIQFGFILNASIALRNASAVAARVGVLNQPAATDPQICTAAQNAITPMLDTNRLPCANVAVARDTSVTPQKVTVTLTYSYPLFANYKQLHVGSSGSYTLVAATTMQ